MGNDHQLAGGRTGGSPCSALRIAYNDCFNRWYSDKFLKGQWDKEECITEWEAYRACVVRHMEDKNLSCLLRVEATCSRQDDPVYPSHSEVIFGQGALHSGPGNATQTTEEIHSHDI